MANLLIHMELCQKPVLKLYNSDSGRLYLIGNIYMILVCVMFSYDSHIELMFQSVCSVLYPGHDQTLAMYYTVNGIL
jgi:hypothetical protein